MATRNSGSCCFILLLLTLLLVTAPANGSPITVSELAHRILAPVHSRYQPTVTVIRELSPYCTRALHVYVGPPDAILSIVIVNPDPQTAAKLDETNHLGNSCSRELRLKRFTKGTILLLPGYGMPKAALLPYSTALAAHGYRSVLVDLRAQGESTGAYIGYGKQEAQDLVQLLRYLKRQQLIAGRLGLFGVSYGAAVALDAAALDKQVAAVVAVAPFARVTEVIRKFTKIVEPRLAAMVSAPMLREAIVQAGYLVGYPLNQADPLRNVSAIRAPVLYLVGTHDLLAPLREVQELAAVTPHAYLVTESEANHLSLTSNVSLIEKHMLFWFERNLGSTPEKASLPKVHRTNASASRWRVCHRYQGC